MKKKVVVIGAGVAGITAGLEILKNSNQYEVTILEESNNIGGISKTVQYKNNRMDIGGHRFFSKNQEVIEWWESILPSQGAPAYDDKKLSRDVNLSFNGADPEKSDLVMLNRNRVSRIYFRKHFFDYPIKMNLATIKNLGFINTMIAGLSYLKAIIIKKPETSLEQFYENRFGHKLYSLFFEKYTEKVWGRHPKDISADWGAQRVKGLSIIAILKDIFYKSIPFLHNNKVETSLIEEFKYPKYGPGQLWERAASIFENKGGNIKKNCKVIGVNTQGNRITSVMYHHGEKSEVIDADFVFSSMPLKDLVNDMEEVPRDVLEIANGLPYRDFVTVGLLLDKLKITNNTKMKTLNNLIPDCWIYVQDEYVKLGRIQIFNNWSPYMVGNPDSTVWIGLEYFCQENDKFWNMSSEEWTQYGISELKKIDLIDEETGVLDSHCEKIKKAYPAYFDKYNQIDRLIQYLNQFDNLYCIGRNGQHRYNNMDHSMMTAFEAVKNMLSGDARKDNIWNVNTENQYHEVKDTVEKSNFTERKQYTYVKSELDSQRV